MKEGRRAGGITAGPESKILEGMTWEEARNLQEAQRGYVGDGVDFKVGAASKGIIQRDFQHHATVFRQSSRFRGPVLGSPLFMYMFGNFEPFGGIKFGNFEPFLGIKFGNFEPFLGIKFGNFEPFLGIKFGNFEPFLGIKFGNFEPFLGIKFGNFEHFSVKNMAIFFKAMS
jgi:hypothetical protein